MPFTPPVDVLNAGHGTLWGNLGDWSSASSYPQAAEALARRVGLAADLGPGQRIVDAGCGAGESLRVWTDDFDVAAVDAVEKDGGMARRARDAAHERGLEDRVRVRSGDVTAAELSVEPVDAVVAVDSAYFFRSRDAFLERAWRALRPGGTLALSDVTLGTGVPATLARLLAPLCGIPRQNLLTPDGLVRSLTAAGFEGVSVEDRTDAVLGGFERWTRHGGGSHTPLPGTSALAIRSFARLAATLARLGGVGYVIVSASRPPR